MSAFWVLSPKSVTSNKELRRVFVQRCERLVRHPFWSLGRFEEPSNIFETTFDLLRLFTAWNNRVVVFVFFCDAVAVATLPIAEILTVLGQCQDGSRL